MLLHSHIADRRLAHGAFFVCAEHLPARRARMTEGDDMTTELSPAADQAFNRLLALRKITHDTNTVTRRSQNVVLQGLREQDLIAVAERLADHEAKFGW